MFRSMFLPVVLVSLVLVAGCATERSTIMAPAINPNTPGNTPTILSTERGEIMIFPPTFTPEGFTAVLIDKGVEKQVVLRCDGNSIFTRISSPNGFYESGVTPRLRSVTAFARTQTDSLRVFAPRQPNGEASGPEQYYFNSTRLSLVEFATALTNSTLTDNADALLLKAVLESPDIEGWAARNAPTDAGFDKRINWKRVGAGVCAVAGIGSQVCRYMVALTPCSVVVIVSGACLATTIAVALGWA